MRPLAAGRPRGIPTEQSAGVIGGPDRVREGSGIQVADRLPITADIDETRIHPIGTQRKMDASLSARMNADRAIARRARFRGGGNIHQRPGAATIERIEHSAQHPVGHDAHEDRRTRSGGQLHVVGAGNDLRFHRGVAHPVPRRTEIQRFEHAADAAAEGGRAVNRRIERRRTRGINHQIGALPDRDSRDRAVPDRLLHERRPAIHTAEHPNVSRSENIGGIHGHHDLEAAFRHGDDVLAGHRAADFLEGRPAVRRELQPAARTTFRGKATQVGHPHQHGVERRVQRIEGQRPDRERLQPVGQRRPRRTGRGGVGGFPNPAVHRAQIGDVQIRRMRQQPTGRARDLFVGDATDLAVARGTRTLRGPNAVRQNRPDARGSGGSTRQILLHGEDRAVQGRRKGHVVGARRHRQIVIRDGQHRGTDRTQPGRGGTRRVAQRQRHRLVRIGRRVVINRHGERFGGLAQGERQRAVGGAVIEILHRRAARGREVHRAGPG